jgi:hypothetical protein
LFYIGVEFELSPCGKNIWRLKSSEKKLLIRMFQNNVRIEKLHDEELHRVSSSPVMRVMKLKEDGLGETCSTHGRDKYYNIFVNISEETTWDTCT